MVYMFLISRSDKQQQPNKPWQTKTCHRTHHSKMISRTLHRLTRHISNSSHPDSHISHPDFHSSHPNSQNSQPDSLISHLDSQKQPDLQTSNPDLCHSGPDSHPNHPDFQNNNPDSHNSHPDSLNIDPDFRNSQRDSQNSHPDFRIDHATHPIRCQIRHRAMERLRAGRPFLRDEPCSYHMGYNPSMVLSILPPRTRLKFITKTSPVRIAAPPTPDSPRDRSKVNNLDEPRDRASPKVKVSLVLPVTLVELMESHYQTLR